MKKKTKKISFCNILLFLSHLRSFLLIFLGQKTKIEKFIFLRGKPLYFKKKNSFIKWRICYDVTVVNDFDCNNFVERHKEVEWMPSGCLYWQPTLCTWGFSSFLFGSHHIHKTRGPHPKLTCDVQNIDAFLCGYDIRTNVIHFFHQSINNIITSSTSPKSGCIKKDL